MCHKCQVSVFGSDFQIQDPGFSGKARKCNLCLKMFPDNMWGWLGLYRHYMLTHEGVDYGLLGPSTEEELKDGIL